MTCEHAETTVLLHLFGEAPSWYAGHLARCEECQEALAEHALTVGLVEGVFREEEDDMQVATLELVGARPRPEAAAPAATRPRRRWFPWIAAAAAGIAVAGGIALYPEPEEPAPVEEIALASEWEDSIEEELDMLTEEFEALARDLEDM